MEGENSENGTENKIELTEKEYRLATEVALQRKKTRFYEANYTSMHLDSIKNEFDNITLTPDEAEPFIRQYLKQKEQRKINKAYFDKVYAPFDEKKFDFEGMKQYLKSYFNMKQIAYKSTPEYIDIYKQLCMYFSGDTAFEDQILSDGRQGSLKKGLMIYGSIGCGKTTLLKAFTKNQIHPFVLISCRDVAAKYKSGGYEEIKRYSGNVTDGFHSPDIKSKFTYAFDDMGTEAKLKHYGDELNAIGEIVLNRYDKGLKLFVTTNLSLEEIKQYYEERVTSRLKEMVNVISFPKGAEDLRK